MISIKLLLDPNYSIIISKAVNCAYRVEYCYNHTLEGVRAGTLRQCRAYVKEMTKVNVPISTFELLHRY